MKRVYRIVILLFLLIFLSTYTQTNFKNFSKNKNSLFQIKNIEVTNNTIISSNKIIEKISYLYEKNIFFINEKSLNKSLETVNFLEKIEVKKKYPNTIKIKLYETKPVAILFKKNDKYLLDNLSNLIVFKKEINVVGLPVVFGENAEKYFQIFFSLLEINGFPKKEIKNYYYFQIGRWDLELLSGQIIKFPSNKTTEAINKSIKLINRKDFSNYKVIDLRIHGKIVVE